MAENVYNWQFNTLPGNANQGAVLMTKNDITQPPFTQDDFVWKAMEDVFGVSDMRIEYDETLNLYKLFKAKGHQDNDGEWIYNWQIVGAWDALTPEVVEALKALKYSEYMFSLTEGTDEDVLDIKGLKKDGTIDDILSMHVVTKEYVDEAIRGLKGMVAGDAISLTDVIDEGKTKTQVSVKFDANDFTLNANNELKSTLIDDTLTTSTTKTYSIDKIKDLTKSKFTYKGVAADITVIPADVQGSVYYVANESDFYVNVGNDTTPDYQPFTAIQEAYIDGAIKLTKTVAGTKADLRYDPEVFRIDTDDRLESALINDTLGSLDTNADQHTYSIPKILSLLLSVMRYKGQKEYKDELPTIGNETGDCWNVVHEDRPSTDVPEPPITGYNYAWNGTSWDRLAGHYVAGTGITIQDNVISATGISFNVGDGLQATGAGTTTTLSTRNGLGLEYVNVGTTEQPLNANQVKKGSGITVNNSGVNVNTGYTTKLENDNVEVNYNRGLTQNTTSRQLETLLGDGLDYDINGKNIVKVGDGITINATTKAVELNTNLTQQATALGTDTSGLTQYTDGKIGVDFSNIKMSQTFLGAFKCADNTNYISGMTVPNMNKYDMIIIQPLTNMASASTTGAIAAINSSLVAKSTTNIAQLFAIGNAVEYGYNGTTAPVGNKNYAFRFDNINFSANSIGFLSVWQSTAIGGSAAWTAYSGYQGPSAFYSPGFAVYGLNMAG